MKKFVAADLNLTTPTNLSTLANIHHLNSATALSISTESTEAELPNCQQLYRHGKRMDQTHLLIHVTTLPSLRHVLCIIES